MVAEIKQIIDSYVLVTYDIPASQGKLRKMVLKELAKIGAMPYTQSVYLIPLSEESFALANEISAGGSAFVWRAKMPNTDKAHAITIKYEDHIHDRISFIQQRIVQIKDHIEAGRLGKATRMVEKTHQLISQLEQIMKTYNPAWLSPEIAILKQNMYQVYNKE